jgi:hypothetical protein
LYGIRACAGTFGNKGDLCNSWNTAKLLPSWSSSWPGLYSCATIFKTREVKNRDRQNLVRRI